MNNKIVLLVAGLLSTLSAHATSPQDNKLLFQARSKVCVAAAEVARKITLETLQAQTFSTDEVLVKQSFPDAEVRQALVAAFDKGGLMRSVLIQSAGFGSAMLPQPEQRKSQADIAEFASKSLLNQCMIDALLKYGY